MTITNFQEMKLSNHAVGTLMMCLQKCLLEQIDIIPILEEMVFLSDKDGNLEVENPPHFQVDVPDA